MNQSPTRKASNRGFYGLVLASSLAFALPGCEAPQVEHVEWEPIEEGEVIEAFQSPTGILGSSVPSDVLDLVEQSLPALIETARFIGYIATVIDDVSEGDHDDAEDELPESSPPPSSDDDSTWGSSLYLRLACPGANVASPYEFSDGEVRFDTPEFDGLDLSSLTDGGQFLLSFDQCHMGSLELDNAFRGRYILDSSGLGIELPPEDPDYPKTVLALDVGASELTSSFGFIAYACGSSVTLCQNDIRVFAELNAGDAGTYVVAFRVTENYWLQTTEISVLIRGADTESTCTFTSSQQLAGNAPLNLTCHSVDR